MRLLTRGWEFDFFRAVCLIERSLEDGEAVGQRGPVARERVRFRPHIMMGFPPCDVRRVTACRDRDSERPFYRFDVTFMGLYGVSTPLPLHFAVRALRSVDTSPEVYADAVPPPPADRVEVIDGRAEPSPLRDFYDILHHRLISLFYRAWTKYRYDVSFGIPDRDRITNYLYWLVGLDPGVDAETLGLDPLRLLRYAGTLSQHPKSSSTLEGTLNDYWSEKYPVKVDQFVGRWVPLPAEDMNRIGMLNSRLGVDLSVGEQVFDLSGAFNIAVGPVDWQTYVEFLPDGPRHGQTRSLARLFCGDPLQFTIEVKLQGGEVPQTRMTSDSDAGRLGFTSWIRTGDVGDTSITFDESSFRLTRKSAGAGTESHEDMMARRERPDHVRHN
jgi:type VI secretion system protein ImpH